MNHTSLHHALATEVVDEHGVAGLTLTRVRLQHSKTDITYTLHAEQTAFNLSGQITAAHLLHRLGFSLGPCTFAPGGQCLAKGIPEDFDIRTFGADIDRTMAVLREGLDALQACGFYVERELFGAGGIGALPEEMLRRPSGDGHNASKKERLKESGDDTFTFVLTFTEGQREKGWTIHYVPKHDPVSEEVSSMLAFLGLTPFASCPEASFDPCRWRFLHFVPNDDIFNGPAEIAHRWFDAHASRFSIGIAKLLTAEAIVSAYGLHLLYLVTG